MKKSTRFKQVLLFGGEQGIRTLEAVLATYTSSSRAPSTSSDNSPYMHYCLAIIHERGVKIKPFYNIFFSIISLSDRQVLGRHCQDE